jgi:hypothetical protein
MLPLPQACGTSFQGVTFITKPAVLLLNTFALSFQFTCECR